MNVVGLVEDASAERSQPARNANYIITSWTSQDGLPEGRIRAFAQDADGYLWIASEGGLVRFDGFQFDKWSALSSARLPQEKLIRALHISRDGAIWVGFGTRFAGTLSIGLSRILENKVTSFGPNDGLPALPVDAIQEDASGTIFVANLGGLFSLNGDRWERWQSERGIPEGPVYQLYTGPSGDLFAVTAHGVFRREAGTRAFQGVEFFPDVPKAEDRSPLAGSIPRHRRYPTEANSICQDSRGDLFISDLGIGVRVAGHPRTPRTFGRGVRLMCDREENLWVGTIGEGLWRTRVTDPQNMSFDQFSMADGLASEGTSALFQDRDGNIWAGAISTLSRITPSRVSRLTTFPGATALEATPDGNVWIGASGGLFRVSPDAKVEHVLDSGRVIGMNTDHRGTLWVATVDGVARLARGETSPKWLPLGGPITLRRIDALAGDDSDGVWLYDLDHGLLHWEHGRVGTKDIPPALRTTRIVSILTDSQGTTWFASESGWLARLTAEGHLTTFGVQDGLESGVSQLIYEDSHGTIWVGGTEGLSRSAGDGFETVYRDDLVNAIVEDNSGAIWIATSTNIICISRETTNWSDDEGIPILESYNLTDGLAGTPLLHGSRSALRAPNGHLWFVTAGGVSTFDPLTASKAPDTRSIRVHDILVDGHNVSSPSDLTLAPGTKSVRITFSALNLTAPEKTEFRYRLDGFDPAWTTAGSERTAHYTNLAPGSYRFRVRAVSNADAGETESTIALIVQPRFYQTLWFPLLCTAAAGTVAWLTWSIRLRLVHAKFATIVAERARLSRDIHDTLLQGLVGIALHLEHVNADPTAPDAKDHLARMQRRVEQYIRQARRTIMDLRTPGLEPRDTATALRNVGNDAVAGQPISFDLRIVGPARTVAAPMQEQFVRVMQEAMTNAVRHAQATSIQAELRFEPSSVQLTVRDDGCGFDPEREQDRGHFGLVTMRERARDLGGDLHVSSRPGHGCSIHMSAPCKVPASGK